MNRKQSRVQLECCCCCCCCCCFLLSPRQHGFRKLASSEITTTTTTAIHLCQSSEICALSRTQRPLLPSVLLVLHRNGILYLFSAAQASGQLTFRCVVMIQTYIHIHLIKEGTLTCRSFLHLSLYLSLCDIDCDALTTPGTLTLTAFESGLMVAQTNKQTIHCLLLLSLTIAQARPWLRCQRLFFFILLSFSFFFSLLFAATAMLLLPRDALQADYSLLVAIIVVAIAGLRFGAISNSTTATAAPASRV